MPDLAFHLRLALRSLRHAPAFTVAALLTLALGIGANSAMFSMTRALLLKPLPFPEPDRLVSIWGAHPGKGVFQREVSAPNFFDWRDEVRSLEGMAIYTDDLMDLAGEGESESVRALSVSSGFFEVLGVRPLLGRTFTREDEVPQAQPVVLLSHGIWQRRYGGDPNIVGRLLPLGGRSTQVIGVMPAAFHAPTTLGQEIFTVFPRDPKGENRGMNAYLVLARLKPGVSLAQAHSDMDAVARAVQQRHPELQAGWTADVVDLHRDLTRETRRGLLLLQGAVLLLLLIACTNLMNLLLVRGASRIRELALRDALGAGLHHQLIQPLTEGLMLSTMGALLGLLLAKLTLTILPAFWSETNALGAMRAPALDGGVLGFTLALTLLTSLVFGLAPLLQLRKGRLQHMLQRDSQNQRTLVRLRSALVLGEVAMATVLLLASGLLLRSLFKVAGSHPGFDPHQVIAFRLGLPDTRYPDDTGKRVFNRDLIRRLEGIPGVERASSCGILPLRRNEWATRFHLGRTALPPSKWVDQTSANLAGPGYLQTLRIPLLQGRDFSTGENRAPEAMVNAAFVRAFIPSGDPLGKHFQIAITSPSAPQGTTFEIVGIVGDQRTYTLESAPEPAVLLSVQSFPYESGWYVLRSRLPLSALASAIRTQVMAMDPQLAVRDLTDLDTLVDQNLGDRRQPLLVLGTFAALALLLSTLGIHGVVTFSVTQRTREIGLRMALGAHVRDILRMIFRQGMTPVVLGILVGLGGFAMLSRFLASQLYDVQPSDPLTIILTLGLLTQASLLACLLPALRAARVQPAVALRSE